MAVGVAVVRRFMVLNSVFMSHMIIAEAKSILKTLHVSDNFKDSPSVNMVPIIFILIWRFSVFSVFMIVSLSSVFDSIEISMPFICVVDYMYTFL